MSYTKGTWKVDGSNVVNTNERTIAIVYDTSNPSHYTELTRANAQLISAAPEMYEALKMVMRRQVIEKGRITERGMPSSDEIIIMQKALDKAEGK